MAAIAHFVGKRREWLTPQRRSDYMVRYLSTTLKDDLKIDAVPICNAALPLRLAGPDASAEQVLSVVLEAFPLPDETCAWQDILDFKADLRDQELDFRHWLKTLATKPQTGDEVKDTLEYTINRYERAMKLHHLQASQSAFEAYVIPAIEFLEDLSKFNWSKLAKLGVSVKQRKIELMRAELTAPGMECAYVFKARERFGEP